MNDFTTTYESLRRHLNSLQGGTTDPELQYELDITERMSEYLARVNAMGREIEDANRGDLARILGKSIDDWQAAQQELEILVLDDQTDRKAELINYLYRYTKRHLHLLGPVLRELEAPKLDLGLD